MLRSFLSTSMRIRFRLEAARRCQSGYGPGTSDEYYSNLGVRKDATQREIKAAYYQLSKKYHPDVAGTDPSAATKFIQISEAYECLRDPDRRRAYDNQSTGGGGRYTGDSNDPFRNERAWRQQTGNPFHNRQFTQQEYQRIWEEFNRLRNERQTYDNRMEWERQRAWNEFARQRAQRWTDFHNKYPNGPPGSMKWEFRFRNENQQGINAGWEMFRKIMMVYFVCFFVISLVRVSLQQLGSISPAGKKNDAIIRDVDDEPQPATERERVQQMMSRLPQSPTPAPSLNYMKTPPMPSGYMPSGGANYSPGQGSEYQTEPGFTMYRPATEDSSAELDTL